MPSYKAPVRDIQFVLQDLLKVQDINDLEGYDMVDEDLMNAMLDGIGKLSEEVIAPLNQIGDQVGCKLENGTVTTPPGFKEAYDQFCDGGWGGVGGNPDYDGQGLPGVMAWTVDEIVNSANLSFSMYPGLTTSAVKCIDKWGTDEQKSTYLPNMIHGRWSGTMNLTEPHCGTDLGMLRTKADPAGDGSYKISGSKIFISAGEHEMSENIVHLVLARLPGAPAGVKGISLFIVPKFMVNADGSLGERNSVNVASIEEKMGIHGNCTCVMNYDEATGYLIGPEHKGLRAMFTMMLSARIGVGMIGLCQAEAAQQNAVAYVNDRIQGRALTGAQNPDKPADPLIVHPDVRRMLMQNRAFIEGARAFSYWLAIVGDRSKLETDEEARTLNEALMGLLTPVLKAFLTDKGFEATVNAQQCFGGHGYIQEWGMDQFVRDARIAQIYEGANGVQALDLVGRQLGAHGGKGIQYFLDMIKNACNEHKQDPELETWARALIDANKDLGASTMWLMENAMKDANNAGSASVDYLYIMGYVMFGYCWLEMAATAKAKLAEGVADAQFYENKLTTAKFYFDRMIVETAGHRRKLEAGSESMMALAADQF